MGREHLDEEDEDQQHEDVFSISDFEPESPKEGQLPSRDWIHKNFRTKSAAIRYLIDKGFKTKDIAELLQVRYQHVRNVATKQLKRGPTETFHSQSNWQCSHTDQPFVDVIVRIGLRDPATDRVLYRVCVQCAYEQIPGVTREAVRKLIPGVKP